MNKISWETQSASCKLDVSEGMVHLDLRIDMSVDVDAYTIPQTAYKLRELAAALDEMAIWAKDTDLMGLRH